MPDINTYNTALCLLMHAISVVFEFLRGRGKNKLKKKTIYPCSHITAGIVVDTYYIINAYCR